MTFPVGQSPVSALCGPADIFRGGRKPKGQLSPERVRISARRAFTNVEGGWSAAVCDGDLPAWNVDRVAANSGKSVVIVGASESALNRRLGVQLCHGLSSSFQNGPAARLP